MYGKVKAGAWSVSKFQEDTNNDLGLSSFSLQSIEDNKTTNENNNNVEWDNMVDQPDCHKTKINKSIPRDMDINTLHKLLQILENTTSIFVPVH